MKPRKKLTPESQLKRAVKDFLDLYRIWTFPVMQNVGSHPGVADRLGIYKGKPLALELKRPGGRLSPSQEVFKTEWEREGGIYIECRSIEDLAAGLGIKTLMGI